MKYIKEDIESFLIEHKSNEGKLIEIEMKIEEYKEKLEYSGTVYEDSKENVIETLQLSGQGYEGIHSKTNKISDKVPAVASKYSNEIQHINKENIIHIEAEINKLEEEKKKINKKIARVKNWLDKIEYEKSCIIKEFYINNRGKNWKKAVKEYSNYEGVKELQERQLRQKRDEGVEDILKIVNF